MFDLESIPSVSLEAELLPKKEDDKDFDFSDLPELNITGATKLSSNKSSTPNNKVSSGYGPRGNEFHRGIDIPLPHGTEVKPFANAEITETGENATAGKYIKYRIGNLTFTTKHLSAINVEKGDKVTPQYAIGLSGNSGRVRGKTGDHVHLEVERDGQVINPLDVFANDPRQVGMDLVLKNEGKITSNTSSTSSTRTSQSAARPQNVNLSDLPTVELDDDLPEVNLDITNEETKSAINNFIPLVFEPTITPINNSWTGTNERSLIARAALGTSQMTQVKPIVQNPNPPGKPITFRFRELPTQERIVDALIYSLGQQTMALNEEFINEPRVKAAGINSIITLTDSPNWRNTTRLSNGEYSFTIKSGISKGLIDQINAYAKGGIEAYVAKQEELEQQSRAYTENLNQIRAEHRILEEKHPYLTAAMRGVQDVSIKQTRLFNNISTLPQAIWTLNRYGGDSKEYEELHKEELQNQLAISQAEESIPKEIGSEEFHPVLGLFNPVLGLSEKAKRQVIRGGVGAGIALPQYAAAGALGGPAGLPILVYLENLHRGNREAAIASLPMALMAGGQIGLDKFLSSEGASLTNLIRSSKEANKDFITSISESAPGNNYYLSAPNLTKNVDLAAISPLQRQLILRGQNALTNIGISAITNPRLDLQEGISQLVIGLGLPVGKFRTPLSHPFERPSIISGDAYTLPDGSVLLQAPINVESGLLGGRISNIEPRIVNPVQEINQTSGRYLVAPQEVQGNATRFDPINPFNRRKEVIAQEPQRQRAILLDLDTAALNLLDLRRALINKEYLIQSKTKDLGVPRLLSDSIKLENDRKVALESSIKTLDEAIPKETQEFFVANENIIRGALRTNYESRIKKEEFIKGNRVIRQKSNDLPAESRPFNPTSRTAVRDNFAQSTRRKLITIEESGRRGLENNKKNKGTFTIGIDVSDIPYLVQIGIGKLGRKGLDFAEFTREFVAEYGEEARKYTNEIYNKSKTLLDRFTKSKDEEQSDKILLDATRINRAEELFGDIGRLNKYFTQERQIEIREDLFEPPSIIELQEGLTGSAKWLGQQTNNLVQIVGFHVEDFYRRGIEPKLDEVIGRLRKEFGDWVDGIDTKNWQDILDKAKNFYQTNNADLFFSGMKQEVLEKLPNRVNVQQVRAILEQPRFRNEFNWTIGLEEFLKENEGRKISRDELIDVIQRGQVRIEEKLLGSITNEEINKRNELYQAQLERQLTKEESDLLIALTNKEKTRYGLQDYSGEQLELQGGKSYKEMLLISPIIDKVENPGQFTPIETSKFDLPEYQAAFDNWSREIKDIQDRNRERTGYNVYDEQASRELAESDRRFRILEEELESRANNLTKTEQDRYRIALNKWNKQAEQIYKSPHWNEENVIAHYRTNERTTTDGIDILFAEEFQSDWNQAGRREGYKGDRRLEEIEQLAFNKAKEIKYKENDVNEFIDATDYGRYLLRQDIENLLGKDVAQEWTQLKQKSGDIPQNPFMQGLDRELMAKRFLRQAVEEGKDGIGWTTSRQQQERYKKLLETKDIRYSKNEDGTYNIEIKRNLGWEELPNNLGKDLSEARLRELVGNEFAGRIIKPEHQYITYVPETNDAVSTYPDWKSAKEAAKRDGLLIDTSEYRGIVSGKEIQIGKGYSSYDTEYVNIFKKIGKRFGARYSEKEIKTKALNNPEYSGLTATRQELIEWNRELSKSDDNTDIPIAASMEKFINELGRGKTFREIVEGNYNSPYGGFVHDVTNEVYIHKTGSHIRDSEVIHFREQTGKIHFLEITPSMRESLLKEGQQFYGLSGLEPLKPSQPIGTRNRIITRDFYDKTKDEIAKSFINHQDSDGTVFNSGLNPDAFLSQIKLLYKGYKDLESFTKSLIIRYGEKVRPFVDQIWEWLQQSILDFQPGIQEWMKQIGEARTPEGRESERGSFSLRPSRRKLRDTRALDVFEESRPGIAKRIGYQLHRGIALAQTYPEVSRIYDTIDEVRRTGNAYATTILGQLGRGVKLLQGDTDNLVAHAIFARNKEQINDAQEDARIVNRFGLNQDQIEAYNHIRGAVNNVLTLRQDTILYGYNQQAIKLNDELASATPNTPKHDDILRKMGDLNDKIQEINSYYSSLRDSGYISLQRIGRYRIEAQNPAFPPSDKENHYLIDYAETPELAQQRINEWQKQYTNIINDKILDSHDAVQFEGIARNLTPGEFEELVLSSGVNPHSEQIEKLRGEIYERYPSMSYQLERKFYKGYKEDNEFMLKSITRQAEVYHSSYYSKIAKQEGLQALESSNLQNSDPTLANVIRRYIEDETTTPTYNLADKIAFKARKFAFMMQLAWDVKQLYLNAVVQPITQNYNYLARVENPINGERARFRDVENVFWHRGNELLAKLTAEGLGKDVSQTPEYKEFREIYDRLKLEKIIEPEYTKSLLELEAKSPTGIDSQFKSFGRRFSSWKQQEHWAGTFMRAGEKTTRSKMAADMFLLGKKFNLQGEELISFIVRGIHATQTNPTRAENPLLVRRLGEPGKLFYQFGAFRQMWFENLILNAKSDWKHKSPAALSRQLGALAIVGGIHGLPLTGFALTLYALATGKNPDKELRKKIKKYTADNDYLEDLALNGITGNQSFSQSAGIDMPILDRTFAESLTQDNYFDKITSSSMPAVMTTRQLVDGFGLIGKGIYNKDFKQIIRGIETGGPKPVRQLLRSERASREGYRTLNDKTIVPKKKITKADLIAQGFLGLTPNVVSEKYDTLKYKKLRRGKIGKASRRLIRKVSHIASP